MFQKLINSTLILPLLLLASLPSYSNEIELDDEINIEKILNKKNIVFEDLESILLNKNLEIKSLKSLVDAAYFNLSSTISKRYPSIDITATGFPQYIYGRSYNNTSADTKSSQLKANPTITLKWDLIDPLRGPDIESAKNNYKIAKNNYEIKKLDLLQEAQSRYHKYQKSYEDLKNAKSSVNLSEISLKDANAKFEAGIGTKFDVLEAKAQLARDKQLYEERKISREISMIALKEILNFNIANKLSLDNNQKLIGVWDYTLKSNLQNGIKNSYSLKNIKLQTFIKQNQAKKFLNSNKPKVFISNSISSSFSKGSTLSTEIDPNKSSSSYTNTVSLNVSWPIFNGGKNKNSFKSKTAEANSENFSYENLKQSIKSDISEIYLNLNKNKRKVLSTAEEILSTKESLKLARLRYEVGISTLKDVLIRQKELSNAKSKKINAIYNYNLNLNRLERLTFQNSNKKCSNNDNKNKFNSFCNFEGG